MLGDQALFDEAGDVRIEAFNEVRSVLREVVVLAAAGWGAVTKKTGISWSDRMMHTRKHLATEWDYPRDA